MKTLQNLFTRIANYSCSSKAVKGNDMYLSKDVLFDVIIFLGHKCSQRLKTISKLFAHLADMYQKQLVSLVVNTCNSEKHIC
jgi:hypothetical protein